MSDNPAVPILYDPVQRMLCPFCRGRMDVMGLAAFTKAICPSCKREVPIPARLGAFLLLDLLGTGGMGGVYRAHDETLGRDVAIKVMLKSLGDSAEFVHTFRREAQAAAKLNHPHIAQIYSFGQEKGQPYIVMELVPGKHLDLLISVTNPLDPAFVMKIGADIAEGLQVASASGLVHGDIKPENILLDERNQAKLVDFGIAGNVNQSQGEIWGTPYYIAPEKVRRQRIDHRSDIYCLGGTLYHALSGRPPFEGADAMEVVKARFKGPPQPLDVVRPGIDPAVVAIISRMLQAEPAMRYPTYDSLLGDMRRYLSRVGTETVVGIGKRIVIKGKSRLETAPAGNADASASSTTSPATTSSLSPSLTSRHKTLLVSRGLTSESSLAGANVDFSASAADNDSKGGEKKPRNGCLIAALWVFLGLLLLGGLGWGGTMLYLKKKASQLLAETQAAQQAARTQVAQKAARIVTLRATLDEMAREGNTLLAEAEKLALAAAGESWKDRILPPEAAEDATNAPALIDTVEPIPVVLQAREVWTYVKPLRQASRNARRISDRLDLLIADARAPTSTVAQIRGVDLKVQGSLADFESVVGRAPEWLRGAKEKLAAMKQTAVTQAEETARAAAARQQEEAAQRAAAERQQQEETARAAAEAETTRVKETFAAQQDALSRHLYADAQRALRALEEEIKSDPGRQALRLAQDRAQGLADLRDFWVQSLNAGNFRAPAGWSVAKASNRSLTVRSASGKVDEVPWERIGVNQIVPFIQFYLLDEQQARELKLRERITQSIRAALYCTLFGDGREAAREMAAKLVAKALEINPDAKAEVQRVLPEMVPVE